MPLNTVEEIERAIEALTRAQVEELYLWLEEHHSQSIDAQLKADLEAGRLDDPINRALDELQIREDAASLTGRDDLLPALVK